MGLGGCDNHGVLQELRRQLQVFSKTGFPCSEYPWIGFLIAFMCV